MNAKCAKLLADIRDAVVFVRGVTQGKCLDDYRNDRLLRQAVERNLEIMGEAIGRLARIDATIAAGIRDYAQIISFRNLLIHGYDLIDDALVWQVLNDDLPALEADVVAIAEP